MEKIGGFKVMKEKIFKVLVIVCIILCFGSIVGMIRINEEKKDIEEQVIYLNRQVASLLWRINDLEEIQESDNEAEAKGVFKYGKIDLDNGVINTFVMVTPTNVTDLTKVEANFRENKIALTRKDGAFTGNLLLPIDDSSDFIKFSIYEGNTWIEDIYMEDDICASEALSDMVAATYEGYVQYGNDRLVLEGEMMFKTTYGEEVALARLICGDEIKEIENKDAANFTVSCMLDKNTEKKVYIELVLKDESKIRLFPEIIDRNYYTVEEDLEGEGVVIHDKEDVSSFYQESIVELVSGSGKSYKIAMY